MLNTLKQRLNIAFEERKGTVTVTLLVDAQPHTEGRDKGGTKKGREKGTLQLGFFNGR